MRQIRREPLGGRRSIRRGTPVPTTPSIIDCSNSTLPRANSTMGGSKISAAAPDNRGIGDRHQQRAGLQHLLLLIHGVVKGTSAGDGLRDAARQAADSSSEREARKIAWGDGTG
jgi:hypothetical protein